MFEAILTARDEALQTFRGRRGGPFDLMADDGSPLDDVTGIVATNDSAPEGGPRDARVDTVDKRSLSSVPSGVDVVLETLSGIETADDTRLGSFVDDDAAVVEPVDLVEVIAAVEVPEEVVVFDVPMPCVAADKLNETNYRRRG